MAAKKTLATRRRLLADGKDEIYFTAEEFAPEYFRAVPPYVVEAERQMQGWNPSKPNTIFQRNRAMLEGGNPWVGAWHHVRDWFFNDGFSFVGETGALGKWLGGKGAGVKEIAARLNNDIWQEWLLNDNAVVFWIDADKGALPMPLVLDCEACQYQSTLGGETLKVLLPKKTLSEEEKRGLNDRWIKAYKEGGWVKIDSDSGENFKVLTRAKRGKGFGVPRLYNFFRLLSTLENLHVADSCGSYQHRDVIRKISAGRDMKFADALRQPAYFTLTGKERKQIEDSTKNKRGAFNVVTDAKVTIEWKFMDPKFFESAKYKGTIEELNRYGGPGMMLMATGQAWLVPFFAAEGRADRQLVGDFINSLLSDRSLLPMKPPRPLTVRWNANSFRDAATVIQAMQFAVAQGAMSVQTAREELGLDNATEGDRLAEELEKPERYRPGFEPKQGMLTSNGRPKESPGADGA